MQFVNMNGALVEREHAAIRVDDRSYRYGDGLFETMKMQNGRILLFELHFARLIHSCSILRISPPETFTLPDLGAQIAELSEKNNCRYGARVRLSISRGHGGLYEYEGLPHYIIECWPLIQGPTKNDLAIDVFPDARKACDRFSNVKSANFLPYVMAAVFAKDHSLDDCVLLNSHERVCDATTANIFWIKQRKIYTPPLVEGCVAGVMRRWLLENLPAFGYEMRESICEVADLRNADEVFLTNAIKGVCTVAQFQEIRYENTLGLNISQKCFSNEKAFDSRHQPLE